MEESSKRSKPKFDTFYPSKEELDWLANNEQWGKLARRVEDKTPENKIKDAFARRTYALEQAGLFKPEELELFPFDILRLIAIRMDVRDVLDNATKLIVFQKFVADDRFWKEKFEYDFPEVMYMIGDFDPGTIPGTEMFKDQPWRRFYYVMKTLMMAFYKNLIRSDFVQKQFEGVYFQFEIVKDSSQRTLYFRRRTYTNPNFYPSDMYGDPKDFTLDEFLNTNIIKRLPTETNANRINFLQRMAIINFKNRDTNLLFSVLLDIKGSKDIKLFNPAVKRLDGRDYDANYNWNSTLREMLAQGYAAKLGDRPVIGGCLVCGEPEKFHVKGDKTQLFCSEQCFEKIKL